MAALEINRGTEEIHQNKLDELAKSEEEEVILFPRIGDISYREFFQDYIQRNVPCVLDTRHTESWPSRSDWVKKQNGELVPDLTRGINDADHFISTRLINQCTI